jgi:hypothetical protein
MLQAGTLLGPFNVLMSVNVAVGKLSQTARSSGVTVSQPNGLPTGGCARYSDHTEIDDISS